MSNMPTDTVKDKILDMVTERNLGFEYRTSSITTFGIMCFFSTNRSAFLKKSTIQFECGGLGY